MDFQTKKFWNNFNNAHFIKFQTQKVNQPK